MRRARLADAAELGECGKVHSPVRVGVLRYNHDVCLARAGMALVAINHASVAERSLTEVREILAAAACQISEETPLTLCFVPRKGGYLYYGGVHGHVRLQRVYTTK